MTPATACAIMAWIVTGLSVTACSVHYGGAVGGDKCHSDGDCPAGLLCTRRFNDHFWNTCAGHACAGAADCAPEQECKIGRDEPNGIKVTRGTCQPRECGCDSECPLGFKCDDLSSSTPLGTHGTFECRPRTDNCDADADCQASKPPGSTAHCDDVDHTQASSSCRMVPERKCQFALQPCACNSDCPAATFCNLWKGGCDFLPGNPCTSNSDCSKPNVCTSLDGLVPATCSSVSESVCL